MKNMSDRFLYVLKTKKCSTNFCWTEIGSDRKNCWLTIEDWSVRNRNWVIFSNIWKNKLLWHWWNFVLSNKRYYTFCRLSPSNPKIPFLANIFNTLFLSCMLVNHSICDLTKIQMCWKLFEFLLTYVLSRALTNEIQFSLRVNYIVFRLILYSVVNSDSDPLRSASFCRRIEIGL